MRASLSALILGWAAASAAYAAVAPGHHRLAVRDDGGHDTDNSQVRLGGPEDDNPAGGEAEAKAEDEPDKLEPAACLEAIPFNDPATKKDVQEKYDAGDNEQGIAAAAFLPLLRPLSNMTIPMPEKCLPILRAINEADPAAGLSAPNHTASEGEGTAAPAPREVTAYITVDADDVHRITWVHARYLGAGASGPQPGAFADAGAKRNFALGYFHFHLGDGDEDEDIVVDYTDKSAVDFRELGDVGRPVEPYDPAHPPAPPAGTPADFAFAEADGVFTSFGQAEMGPYTAQELRHRNGVGPAPGEVEDGTDEEEAGADVAAGGADEMIKDEEEGADAGGAGAGGVDNGGDEESGQES